MTDNYTILIKLMEKIPITESKKCYLLSKTINSYWRPTDFIRFFRKELEERNLVKR